MGLRQNGLSQKVPTVSYKINKSNSVLFNEKDEFKDSTTKE